MKNNFLIFFGVIFISISAFANSVDKKNFEKPIKKYLPELQACRGDASTSTFMVSGKVVVDLEINDTAKISRIKINDEKTTLQDLNLQKCVVDVMKTIKFPKAPKGTIVALSYPITFK